MSKSTQILAALGVVAALGVAALPLGAYADVEGTSSVSDNLTVRATIEDYIAIEITADTNGTLADDTTVTDAAHDHVLDLGKLINNGAILEGDVKVTVKTNNKSGYTLKLKADGSDTNLAGVNTDETIEAGVPTVGTSAWGFKGGLVTNYQAIDNGDGVKIAETTAANDITVGETTNVTFGVTADKTQAADVYSKKVIFTASTNNN